MPALTPLTMSYRSYFSDGTASSLSTLSDDLMRTKIAEDPEEEDAGVWFDGPAGRRFSVDRRSSIGGVSSSDSLWGDARRLSEAGVRRTSDASVPLTEDTDSFIIGDKVWVGGTRPGQIAYIGETKFGPGDWAGIVLEQPIGKNDGSVGGTRYFQCEPKKGVFSRLSRLSRVQLGEPPRPLATSTPRQVTPPPHHDPPSRRTTPPPSLHSSTHSAPPTPIGRQDDEPKIGDRVIVKSGGASGSKAGILRFKGVVKFQPGVWCGVELDEPVGKNDGSVEGFRYFICEPSHGLFAPASKVSKSPVSARQMPSCQIHNRTSHQTLKRASSKESILSTSSVRTSASTTKLPRPVTSSLTSRPAPVQTPISRPKTNEVQELQKERDLLRAQMIKAAELVEITEKDRDTLRLEYERFRAEVDSKINENKELIAKLEEEKAELLTQLEDVQFRAEEETINKSDIEVSNQQNVERIEELERLLEEEKKNVDKLTVQSNQLFEAEEAVIKFKDEIEVLKAEKERNEADFMAQLSTSAERNKILEEKFVALEKELYEFKVAKNSTASEETALMLRQSDELKELLKENNNELTVLRTERNLLSENLSKATTEINDLISTRHMLQMHFEEAEVKIKNTEMKLNSSLEESKAVQNKLEEVICKLKSELESSNQKCVESEELVNILKADIESNKMGLQNQLVDLEQKNSSCIQDLKLALETCSKNLTVKEKELSEEKIKIDQNEKEFSSVKKDLEDLNLSFKEKCSLLDVKEKELNALRDDLEKAKQDFFSAEQKLKKELEALICSNQNLNQTYSEMENRVQTVKLEYETDAKNKNSEICNLNDKVSNLEATNNCLTEELLSFKTTLETTKTHLNESNVSLKKKDEDYQRCLNTIIEKETLIENLGKISNELNSKITEGQCLEKNLQAELDKVLLEITDVKNRLQTSESRRSELVSQKEKLENDISSLMNTSSDSSDQLVKLNSDLREKEKELERLKAELSEKSREWELRDQQKEQEMERERKELKSSLEESKEKQAVAASQCSQLSSLKAKLENEIETLKTSYNQCTQEFHNLNSIVNQKEQEFEKIKTDLSESVSQLEKKQEEKVVEIEIEKKKLKSALDEALAKQEVMSTQLADLTKNKEELEKELTVLKSTSHESVETVSKVTSELKLKEKELENAKEEMLLKLNEWSEKEKSWLANNEKEKIEFETALEDSSMKLKQALAQCSDLSLMNEKLTQRLSNIETSSTESSEKISSMCSELLEKEKDLEALRADILKKTEQWEMKESNTVAEIEKEKHEITAALEASSAKMEATATALEEKSKELMEQRQKCEQLTLEVEENCKKLKETTETLSGKEALLEEKLKTIASLEKAITDAQMQKGLSDNERNDLNDKTSSLLAEINVMRENEKIHSENINSLTQSNSEMKIKLAELQEIKKKCEDLTTSLESVRKECELSQNSCSVLKKECNEKAQEISLLQTKISNTSDGQSNLINDLKSQNEDFQKCVDKLNEELSRKNIQIKSLETQMLSGGGSAVEGSLGEKVLLLQVENDNMKEMIAASNQTIASLTAKNNNLMEQVQHFTKNGDVQIFRPKKEAAPRLFCDICDEFDGHDTEDCPLQATSDSPPPRAPTSHKPPRTAQPPRLYCDICEMFDHDTADCQDLSVTY